MGKISKNELNTSLATKIEEIDLKANISDLETTNSQLAQIENEIDADVLDLTNHKGSSDVHGATHLNTANKIVKRDSNGDFYTRILNCFTPSIAISRRQSIGQTGSLYDTYSDFAGNLIGTLGYSSGGSFDFFISNAKVGAGIVFSSDTGEISIRKGDGSEAKVVTGENSPEGTIVAPIGSIFLRTNGGASTTLYVKQSGSGNTGWVAK